VDDSHTDLDYVTHTNVTLHYMVVLFHLQEPAAEAPAVNGDAHVVDVAAAAAVESDAPANGEGPKRVVARERHTLFVGNLPFGKYRTHRPFE
jgi:hypothetical protein